MRKKVVLSKYCWFVSILTISLICGIFIYTLRQPDHIWPVVILGTIMAGLLLSTPFYMPLSISIDSKSLKIRRPLRTKAIPLSEIASVKICPPTMGAIRIFGSGGWFGWYGWFRERDLGKYFAYYGKASDCFLVTLKDGRKYLLGCTDAPSLISYLTSHLN